MVVVFLKLQLFSYFLISIVISISYIAIAKLIDVR